MKFRCCIELLQNNGQLKEVTVPVSAQLEMAAIVKRQLTKSSSSPALLFRSIEECSFSCVANLFGTTDRISMILSGNDGDSLDQRMAQLDDGLDSFSSFMSWLSAADECKPKRVCPPDMIQLDDFSDLPAIKVWPEDAGHYLSLAVVICRTRQGQRVNCGIYRVQIHGPRQATIRFRPGSDGHRIFAEYQKHNEPMPIAIVLGCDPALMFAAVFPLSSHASELCFASYIQQQPLSFYCSELSSLPIPTPSEVVIQGSLDPAMTLPEGPFGNHEGYYSDIEQCPVFNLEHIESRRDAVIPTTMVGGPPTENMVLGSYVTQLIIPLVKRQIPQVLHIFMPPETVFHGCAFIQLHVDDQLETVKQQIQNHQLFVHSKFLVFVDDEIDVNQPQQLFWRVINHYRHSAFNVNIASTEQIVIDTTGCCLMPHQRLHSNAEIEKKVSERWHELGLDT
ncbi:MAG: hypothetical protein B6I37_02170 [Desulfobacteraceae bacterium 4572_35.2]|nr:MAG: hypothetical protein B6I37_02170 [Desulfobacteraceae bacterium 4572_35.2]